MTEIVRITVTLPSEIYDQLNAVARQSDRTVSAVVRRALRFELQNEPERRVPVATSGEPGARVYNVRGDQSS